MRIFKAACLAGLLPLYAAAQDFPPECPRLGTLTIVADPARWADQCFAAINGRLPDATHLGERDTISRDIDLDGEAEQLEVRGVGNASKQIYVFRQTTEGFVYLGELNAHPSFVVVPDDSGIATIEYTHRFGAGNLEVKRIQYIGSEFVEVRAVSP